MNAPPKPPRRSKLPRWLSGAVLERLIASVVLSLAAFFLWSSVSHLSRVRQESRSLSTQIAQLSGQIDVMRAEWPSARTQQLAQRFPAAESNLFHGPPAVAEWIGAVHAHAIPLALDTEFAPLGLQTQSFDRVVTIMRTRLDVTPSADATSIRPSYQRLLALGQTLLNQPNRIDIVELSVHGSSNSVGEASAVLELWADTPASIQP